jgi:hypothetical protein
VACPRRTCKNVVRFPIPQNASFTVDSPLPPEPVHEPAPAALAEVQPAPQVPEPVARAVVIAGADVPERSEAQACASCGHRFTLRYKYVDTDSEAVIWVQCPNCGGSLQVWVLEGAYDIQV